MQVAFSDKHDTGVFLEKPSKATEWGSRILEYLGSRGVLRRGAKTKTCAVLSAYHVVFEGVTSDYRRWIC